MVKREKLFHFSTPTIEASVPTPITNSICIHMWQFHATNCWFVGVLIGRTETNISLFCSLIYFFLEFLWGTFRYTCIICYSLKVIRGIKQIANGGFVGIFPHVKKPCRRARYWFLSFPLGHPHPPSQTTPKKQLVAPQCTLGDCLLSLCARADEKTST